MTQYPSNLTSPRSFASGRILLSLLLLAALHPLGGAASCDPIPCTSSHPDYDPLTGLCTQPDDDDDGTSPAPGTGNLPTEPNTPTTAPADDVGEDEVDLDLYGLNGKWTDNGRAICIVHGGSGVSGTYIEVYVCEHLDGTDETSTTHHSFDAQLTDDKLLGTTSICRYGFDEETDGPNGITETSFFGTLSPDGKTIEGAWFNEDTLQDIPFTITRDTVGNCQAL